MNILTPGDPFNRCILRCFADYMIEVEVDSDDRKAGAAL
jgi:hypothetical protein